MKQVSLDIIGYSAWDRYEQVYEYVENSCFIASSRESLRTFMANCFQPADAYRVEAVRLADIERDFGVSNGEFAIESAALERFRQAAKARNLGYTAGPYDGDASSGLFAVVVDYAVDNRVSRASYPQK